jgi:hypothetical protein
MNEVKTGWSNSKQIWYHLGLKKGCFGNGGDVIYRETERRSGVVCGYVHTHYSYSVPNYFLHSHFVDTF